MPQLTCSTHYHSHTSALAWSIQNYLTVFINWIHLALSCHWVNCFSSWDAFAPFPAWQITTHSSKPHSNTTFPVNPTMTSSPPCSHILWTFLQLHLSHEIGKQINRVKRLGLWSQADIGSNPHSAMLHSFKVAFIEYKLHKTYWARFQEYNDDKAVVTLKEIQS